MQQLKIKKSKLKVLTFSGVVKENREYALQAEGIYTSEDMLRLKKVFIILNKILKVYAVYQFIVDAMSLFGEFFDTLPKFYCYFFQI